jgi:ADP-ribose pyrophosphatase
LKGKNTPRILNSKLLAKSWRIEYFEDTVQRGAAPPAKYTWYHSPDSVLIVVRRRDGLIPLVRQYRHGARREFWGVPAGLLEDGESPLECARREFREEVGNELLKPELEAVFYTIPSRSDQRAYLFTGGVGRETVRKADKLEPLVTRFVSVQKAKRLLSKDVEAAHYLAFLVWLQNHRPR